MHFHKQRTLSPIRLFPLVLLLLLTLSNLCSSTSTTSGRRTKIQPPNEPKQHEPKESNSDHGHVQNSSISDAGGSSEDPDGYWLEVKAIIGGVLGFWGGVVGLGAVFLVVVISQRYCCKKRDRDDKDGTQ